MRGNGTDPDDADDTDVFVVKYNSTGGLLWETSWGTSDLDAGNGVAVDDGSSLLYVVGTTRGSMGADVLTLGSVAAEEGGQTSEKDGTGSADPKGEIVAANKGASDVFLTCLDATDGDIRWTVQFGSAASDVGNSVAVGPRGGVFVVGQLGDDDDPSLAGARAFLAKYDYLGNAQVCFIPACVAASPRGLGFPRGCRVVFGVFALSCAPGQPRHKCSSSPR